jgi:flavin-dependent thymidylate synthase
VADAALTDSKIVKTRSVHSRTKAHSSADRGRAPGYDPAMEVRLAGHNLDRDLLDEIRAALERASKLPASLSDEVDRAREEAARLISKDNWTPETLSAAYARISRDPRSIGELRAVAREAVDAARRSNESIIFGFGHASVAEHAVLNLDILGLSRLAVEEIERMRLCSYTEKSQRYILLDEDFVVPEEVTETGLEDRFRVLVQRQNAFYREAYDRLLPWVCEQNPELASEKKHRRTLEGWAKEDARYGLSLATTVQLGETLNARSCEALIARTAGHPLLELREFSRRLYAAVAGVAPSVIKHVAASEGGGRMREELRGVAATAFSPAYPGGHHPRPTLPVEEVVLLDAPEDGEIAVVAAILHTHGDGRTAEACRDAAAAMGPDGRLEILRTILRNLGPHDPVPREFEYAPFRFEIVISSAGFGQLKRHRMATLTVQDYDPALGVTIPPSFESSGLVEPFERLRGETEDLYALLSKAAGVRVASYILLNAHRRRVIWGLNARELYHVARLRLDVHAQWDIRRLCTRVIDLARGRFPGMFLMACGRDVFDKHRREIFGDPA